MQDSVDKAILSAGFSTKELSLVRLFLVCFTFDEHNCEWIRKDDSMKGT